MSNKLQRLFKPTPEEQEEDRKFVQKIWNDALKKKDCITCVNCIKVREYPAYITGEECDCIAGLECDTIMGIRKNCDQWIERGIVI